VPCEEKDRLTAVYLAAVVKNALAGRTVADIKSEAWREATKETRAACEKALEELNRHKAEHGC